MESKRVLGALPRRRRIDVERHARGAGECVRARRGRPGVGAQCALEPTQTFGHVALEVPEARCRSRQPKDELALPVAFAPIQGGSQVVVLTLQPVGPLRGVTSQVRLGLLSERQEVLRVAAAQLISLAGGLEPLGRVFADRLQHPEPVIYASQKALLDERLQSIEIGIGDLLSRLERAAAAEDRKPTKEALLVTRQQLVAPFDRRAQRALALA